MNHRFPTITHIMDILPYVEGREDMVVGERDGFTFIDYVITLPDTFQDPDEPGISLEEQSARIMRMECRGIKFYAPSGTIAARPFHKFFNVGERAWTMPHVIDWSEPFEILDKMDGSMIHPLWLNGEVHFCTRMGITDVAIPALAHAWAMDRAGQSKYREFLEICEEKGWTPLFEWCSRKQRIVIDHPMDRLVLTGIRHKVSGYYVETFQMIGEQFNIPVVGSWGGAWEGFDSFRDHVKSLVDAEGYVLRWQNGHMAKTKGDWYCAIHRAMDAVHWEKDVVELLLDKALDDVLPNLLPSDRDRLERFQTAFWNGVMRTIGDVGEEINQLMDEWQALGNSHTDLRGRDRWFAGKAKEVWSGPERGALRSLAFKLYHGHPPLVDVEHELRLHIGSGPRLAKKRALFGGVNWEDF